MGEIAENQQINLRLITFLQTVDKLKDLLDKENITYSIDLFYSKEGLRSLDREPFSVCG